MGSAAASLNVSRCRARASSPRIVIANEFSKPSGSSQSRWKPLEYSARTCSRTTAGSVTPLRFSTLVNAVPVYSGYMSISPREQRLVRQQRSAEIELALHRLMQARLDMLRDDLAQDQLLGEILGADHDVGARAAAGEQRSRARTQQRIVVRSN